MDRIGVVVILAPAGTGVAIMLATAGLLAVVARLVVSLRRQVRVTLDDFGTGYSLLGHIRDLPLDGVTLDRAFTRDLMTPADAWNRCQPGLSADPPQGLEPGPVPGPVRSRLRRRLREMRRPVVLSGSGDDEDIERAYELGINACLVKPAGIHGLPDVIARLDIHHLLVPRRIGGHGS